jgi:hypothetical protein
MVNKTPMKPCSSDEFGLCSSVSCSESKGYDTNNGHIEKRLKVLVIFAELR